MADTEAKSNIPVPGITSDAQRIAQLKREAKSGDDFEKFSQYALEQGQARAYRRMRRMAKTAEMVKSFGGEFFIHSKGRYVDMGFRLPRA